VLTKTVCERTPKIAILKHLQTHFKAKREKGVGTPFPRVPAPLHPCSCGTLSLDTCSQNPRKVMKEQHGGQISRKPYFTMISCNLFQ